MYVVYKINIPIVQYLVVWYLSLEYVLRHRLLPSMKLLCYTSSYYIVM